ncbi:crosslink repair DNA glycosylase YcaQ family protein [Agreia sp. VKM Ac-1783]|uniref:winged helix-turn-helix domain-containing protein n=1 Tax=Agreia sp. VKM Ac-1783 TaxID=1938889 RepID=UPI000A38DF67|nr:crosslink repair DNA glycosylase YcaQ family protein [Agreia sp. VKM Ac-1783]
MAQSLSPALARRVALAAQGFGRPSTDVVPGVRQIGALIDRLGLLQIDSVNVFERSHYLPVFARLGSYDKAQLDRVTYSPRITEYWAHEASFIPVDTLPLLRWRQQEHRDRAEADDDSWFSANRPMTQWLLAELAAKGPMRASEIEHDSNTRSGSWWGWSDVKRGLETLFRWGDVVSAGRTRFERVYALPEQVLPADIRDLHVPRDEAMRRLVSISARAHGVGTADDIADYFRLKAVDAVPAIRQLEEAGELVPVTIDAWAKPAWLHRDARLPRRIDAAAILSPFDPVVWARSRALRLFDFHYRIEIYTPEPKRVFGYYVLPVLIDDRVVGRVDLKNDRQARVLRVRAAWAEDGAPDETAPRLASVLRQTMQWQGLDSIDVSPKGNLSAALAAELAD